MNILTYHAPKHVAGVLHRGVEIDGGVQQPLAAAEGRQLAGEGRGAVTGLLDRLHFVDQRILVTHVADQQVAVAGDDGEHIVEIVGDAA